jgi:8-oxo-dGTP diphosphatase
MVAMKGCAVTPQRPRMHVVRESEIVEMRRRLDELEEMARLSQMARQHHEERKAREAPSIVAAIVTSPLGVLVGRRNDATPPWTFIAGEQDAVQDENPADTAVREVKEETGLRVQAGDVIGQRVHPKTGHTMIYLAAMPTHGTDVFVGDEDELAEVRWVSLAEADELLPGMFEPVREHLARELGEG